MKKKKPIPKTEGQRLLLEEFGSERVLSATVGCGKTLFGYWRRGERIPSEDYKHKLELVFGIPRRAWDIAPGAKLPKEDNSKKEPEKTPETAPKLASRAKGLNTLEITKLQIDDILDALDSEDLTDAAQAKLRDTLAKALALRTRLERDQELLEDRFVHEHPEWIRLKKNILKALEPYPAATKAVIEAIGGPQ